MNIQLLNRISNLNFYGFYDPSKELVTVHFFNEKENKPDVIAYLRHDMSWDVREIVKEQSILYDNKEVITILHKPLGIESTGEAFDEFIRLGLTKMAIEMHGEDTKLSEVDIVFMVFKNNSYE
ncbi:hypothetical protein LCGC14_1483200 [marine sediment metagenome]|uniref:Uncharacterized protein n=1 Tax=marine sediment metagenome TaxID=412755 RepID=A0A0F9J9I8_9ZZZZ